MDISLVIKQRLEDLGLEQRDLASAVQVTESYISQLLTRKKAPPAPNRTDIYERIAEFLNLPVNELAKLAEMQRHEELLRKLADPPAPLHKEGRELVLGKCKPTKQKQIRAIFEKDPFGELERLVTQKLLDVVKGLAGRELQNENWVRLVGRLTGQTYQQTRVVILEFLDTDVFHISGENCVSFLAPLIESWDIDLKTFAMEIILSRRVAPGFPKKFEFVEKQSEPPFEEEPGFKKFLRDSSLRGDVTDQEIEFLKKLRFMNKRPTALYYYRELQNLRDPLHFRTTSAKK